MKRVILIGATGIIGKRLQDELTKDEVMQVITVSRTGDTDLHADIGDTAQIKEMFRQTGVVDAVISVAGTCFWGPLMSMTEEQVYVGIRSKMMGQINLVLEGHRCVSEGGSFTLTSGFLSDDPVPGGAGYAIVNGAIDNFVLAGAVEFAGRLRINAVSPGWVTEGYGGLGTSHLPGQLPVSPERVMHAYYKAAFGFLTGQVFRVWEPSTQFLRK